MTERSWPWPGIAVGDGGPYSSDHWDDMFEMRFGSGAAPYNDRGVIRNWANELEVTDGGANTADVDTGAALVHGKHYDNDAVVNVNIPNATATNWREDLICLQALWAAQTVRIFRHANPAENVVYEVATQLDGNLWEIPLAAVRINDAGVITQITDLRDYMSDLMQPKQLFVRAFDGDSATRIFQGYHEGVSLDLATEQAGMEFMVPLDFKVLLSAHVRLIGRRPAGAPGTFDWTAQSAWGACDESQATHTDTTTADGVDATNNFILCIDVTAALDSANLLPEDQVGCAFILDAIYNNCLGVVVLGLDFRYE